MATGATTGPHDPTGNSESSSHPPEEQTKDNVTSSNRDIANGQVSDAAAKSNDHPQEKMSKNQLKRKLKLEQKMEQKRKRKQQERDRKVEKAKAEGRDLEEERRLLEERTKEGKGRKKRQEEWERKRLPRALSSFQVCLDCSFESHMTVKEINSLAMQIRYCYGENKNSTHPCLISVTSAAGETLGHLQNVSGFSEWYTRAFTWTSQPFQEHFKDRLDKVVYLTSDSSNVLSDLDDDKIYVIGGIVDRNRLRRAAINKAESLGVATAKLPIDEYLKKMATTRVLTCNHVFQILLKFRENGKNWQQALLDVLPSRKAAKALEGGDDGSNN